jgi:CRISPR-associated exonuclease Cas4
MLRCLVKVSRRVWLSVRDVEEYFFCPRMFYYKHVLGDIRESGLWSSIGSTVQSELSDFVRKNFEVVEEEAYLEDEMLGVRGRVDYIVKDNYLLAPLEIKYSRRLKPWWKYTITLYGILLENKYGVPVKRGYMVIPGPKIIVFDIMDHDRRYVLESINKCRDILSGKYVPKPYFSHSCINCDYRNRCFSK